MLWRLRAFPDFCEPCLPSPVERPPAGSDWVYEIKHDGFRLLARRGAAGVRLFIRNGHDWTERFPLIFEALNALKVTTCPACTSRHVEFERSTGVESKVGGRLFEDFRGTDTHAPFTYSRPK